MTTLIFDRIGVFVLQTTTYLGHPVQQPSQHLPSLQFGPLHDLQLHYDSIYLGHNAADGVLHSVHSSHEAVGNHSGEGKSHLALLSFQSSWLFKWN